jgi:hypothetical protein
MLAVWGQVLRIFIDGREGMESRANPTRTLMRVAAIGTLIVAGLHLPSAWAGAGSDSQQPVNKLGRVDTMNRGPQPTTLQSSASAGYHPRPATQQGRVGAPGTLPTPTSVMDNEKRMADTAPGGGRYTARPLVSQGRVGDPIIHTNPSLAAGSSARTGTAAVYVAQRTTRSLDQMGRVGRMNPQFPAGSIATTTPSASSPVYAPRSAGELGRVASSGSIPLTAATPAGTAAAVPAASAAAPAKTQTVGATTGR